MTKTNVLIFPAGEINSIELHNALSTCVNIELWGASSIDRHGEYVFENYISGLPMISEPNFLEKFNRLLKEKSIDVVFPTHDTIAAYFAGNQSRISAKVIVADEKTSEICRDKLKTFELFKGEDFCPQLYNNFENLPVFIKPRKGQGAVGAKLISCTNDIPNDIDLSQYVICECLSGEEYTVDCLTDRNGELKVVSPRSRKRMLAGVCVNGKVEKLTEEIKSIAQKINEGLKFRGLWWFQIKRDDNKKFKLLEISTRCAGTMCLTRGIGYNLPLLSVYDAMGYDINVRANNIEIEVDRTLISRYKTSLEYDTVYFDFDDTLIINNKVHLPSIWFLYQCKNNGKRVVLLTKHENEIFETMKKYHIEKDIFDKIVHIKPNDSKADYIDKEEAIFIDNAYKERQLVQEALNIPVFDVDGIEVLMDWRG